MLLSKPQLAAMLLRAAALWREHQALLSDIDSRFGDGDHGVTIGKIANLIDSSVAGWDGQPVGEFLAALGDGIMAIGGGSAGPLYGTLIGSLAGPLDGAAAIDATMLKAMLRESRDGLFAITKARTGDKTMMDALIPAVDAAVAAEDDFGLILAAAARAAAAGAEATEGLVSRFGRARSYGDKTLGTRDAGACSTALFFQGLSEGFSA
ncbi:conserved hypothetical protein [uncultured delta proteobacterium]|uniref:DhaL domain-containing protein n=1 Tax=uncultured delta proteobacterium TaxID=34034 RepID=A0A212KF36_9DELT|nr:conserved hypothetical protein [uncultured delta proteobacterium]